MHAEATACRAQLVQSMASLQDRVVLLDASDLQQFDSSALAVLLEFRRECARAGKRFVIQGLPQRLRELAALYGIDGLLTGV